MTHWSPRECQLRKDASAYLANESYRANEMDDNGENILFGSVGKDSEKPEVFIYHADETHT